MHASAKQTAMNIISHLPDEASLEDIMYKLYVCQSIDLGQKAIQEGKTFSNEEAKARLFKNES